MLPTTVIENHFRSLSPEKMEILLELRNLIAKAQPDAEEVIRRQGLVYYDSRRGGPVSAGICQILIIHGELRLAFIHGAFMPDPTGLLVNEGGSRMVKRYVPLSDYEHIPWKEIEALILAHSQFDPYKIRMDKNEQ